MRKIFLGLLLATAIISCKKNVPLPEEVLVPERLEMSPASTSVLIGSTTNFTLKFYNNKGVLSNLPATTTWSSDNTAVATITQQGVASGVANGTTNIKASYNNISATAILTVVANNTQLASIMLMPSNTVELLLNANDQITAVGKNNAGTVIPGLSFQWLSNASNMVQVSSTGMITGAAYGTTNITASAMGVQSAPVMVQVIRKGNFAGSNSMGAAKLKIENGVLKLQTTTNFSVANAPDLRIYLGPNATNVNGAVQIAPLSTAGQTSGERTWTVPNGVSISQYRYAIVWCAQFGGTYGVADLGL